MISLFPFWYIPLFVSSLISYDVEIYYSLICSSGNVFVLLYFSSSGWVWMCHFLSLMMLLYYPRTAFLRQNCSSLMLLALKVLLLAAVDAWWHSVRSPDLCISWHIPWIDTDVIVLEGWNKEVVKLWGKCCWADLLRLRRNWDNKASIMGCLQEQTPVQSLIIKHKWHSFILATGT
jgi:hypothetical protein